MGANLHEFRPHRYPWRYPSQRADKIAEGPCDFLVIGHLIISQIRRYLANTAPARTVPAMLLKFDACRNGRGDRAARHVEHFDCKNLKRTP